MLKCLRNKWENAKYFFLLCSVWFHMALQQHRGRFYRNTATIVCHIKNVLCCCHMQLQGQQRSIVLIQRLVCMARHQITRMTHRFLGQCNVMYCNIMPFLWLYLHLNLMWMRPKPEKLKYKWTSQINTNDE